MDSYENKVPVATVYYENANINPNLIVIDGTTINGELPPKYLLTDQRYTVLTTKRNKYYESLVEGLQYLSGGIFRFISPFRAPITETILMKNDIKYILPALNDNMVGYEYYYFYHTTVWNWNSNYSNIFYHRQITTTTNDITRDLYYNESGITLSNVPHGNYCNIYIIFTTILGVMRYSVLMGQKIYTSISGAISENPNDFIFFDSFPINEGIIKYKIILIKDLSYIDIIYIIPINILLNTNNIKLKELRYATFDRRNWTDNLNFINTSPYFINVLSQTSRVVITGSNPDPDFLLIPSNGLYNVSYSININAISFDVLAMIHLNYASYYSIIPGLTNSSNSTGSKQCITGQLIIQLKKGDKLYFSVYPTDTSSTAAFYSGVIFLNFSTSSSSCTLTAYRID